MRRLSRDIDIFNVSALDLFASALGAFILICLIVFPFYQNRTKAEETFERLEIEHETARVEAQNLRKQAAESVLLAARAKADQNEIREEIRKLEISEAANAEAQKKLAALKKEADKRVEFALLGLPLKSEHFLVVIDMSGSMIEYVPQMQKAVQRILAPLDENTTLSILTFQSFDTGPAFRYWPERNRSLPMTESNKQEAYRFAVDLAAAFDGGTPTLEALLEALDHPAPAIVLLSDGAPNLPGMFTPEEEIDDVVRQITSTNGGRKEIHTVAIGDYVGNRLLVKFLVDVATRNGGSFVGITR